MAGLADRLRRLIAASGPIPVSTFMAEALGHNQFGYYRTRDPLGAAGDFTTAPEVSQVFGELIGLWSSFVWRSMGAPAPVNIVELGPGRGTLMADFLRAAVSVDPAFAVTMALHLVDTSAPLRALQSESLSDANPTWHDDLSTAPPGPTIWIANEFFDALPIRQLIWRDGAWHERLVTSTPQGFEFAHAEAPSPFAIAVPEELSPPPEGAVFEFCPAAQSIAQTIGARLADEGGAALIVDYGHVRQGFGDTLQAMAGHEFADPLADPGNADLTAHVDFAALAATFREAGTLVPAAATQGDFLRALGIEARREMLLAAARPDQRAELDTGITRLIAPDQMGTMFKVLAATGPHVPLPPGFEA